MPVSVRLDRNLHARLERMARTTGRTKSELIREAIVRFDESLGEDAGQTLYEQLREYVGIVELGRDDRARGAEELPEESSGQTRRS